MNIAKKRNRLLVALLLSLFLTVVGIVISFNFTLSAKASGSDIDYSPSVIPTRVALDVNGLDSANPENKTMLTANNGLFLKRRSILLSTFLPTNAAGTIVAVNDIVYVKPSEFFTLDFTVGSSFFEINALKSTDDVIKPRIKLIYTDTVNANKKTETYIEIEITSSFVPGNDKADEVITVGAKRNETNTGLAVNSKPLPISITNYTTIQIDLVEYLQNRVLTTDIIEEGKVTGKKVIGGEPPHVINDATRFKVISAEITSMSTLKAVDISIVNNEKKYSRSITVKTNIPQDIILNFPEIWKNPDSQKFMLSFVIENLNAGDLNKKGNTINIPVRFVSYPEPVMRTKFLMPTNLNAGSVNHGLVKEDFSNATKTVKGFSTVRVYPSYLIEYPNAYGYKFILNEIENPNTSGKSVVSVASGVDESGVAYWDVTGLNNDSEDLVFTIHYGAPSAGELLSKTMQVPVTFNVYGKYNVSIGNIEGSKKIEFSYDSTIFSELKLAKYRIKAEPDVINIDSTDNTVYASAAFLDNKLIVSPKINCAPNVANIVLSLINPNGQEIEILIPLVIDIEAGDLFAGWALWTVILFWIGIGLAVILILFFVVWLFMRSIHKRKMDELETSAPTSAYIIKLNSTIAAAQAQQRLATTQAFSNAQSQMLQLGAGPVSAGAPSPSTLQLGANSPAGATQYSGGAMSMPPMGDFNMPPSPPPTPSEIYIPISDDELLEQIFAEKFEPRGMLRRTFFKSKDLQARELEKEKERIRNDVRNGMTIEEACSPFSKRSKPDTVTAPKDDKNEDPMLVILGFKTEDALVVPQDDVEIIVSENASEAEKLRVVEISNSKINEQLSIIEERLSKTNKAIETSNQSIENGKSAIETLNEDIKAAQIELDDISFRLATARGKDRDRLTKDCEAKEKEMKSIRDEITAKKKEVDANEANVAKFSDIASKLSANSAVINTKLATSNSDLENARKIAKAAAEREERAKRKAELERKLDGLNPMMLNVNKIHREIAKITTDVEMAIVEKNSLKVRQQSLQTELLSTTSAEKISALSEEINSLNKKMAELDKKSTINAKLKTDKNIELTGLRRKANELIDKENMELAEVIAAEDKIIGELALNDLREENSAAKYAVEEHLNACQNKFEQLSQGKDTKLMQAAAAVAEEIALVEAQFNEASEQLDNLNLRIDAVTDDSEKMDLTIEQMSLTEQVSTLSEQLDTIKAEGIKRNLEMQIKGEADLEDARAELEKAQADFEDESQRYNDAFTKINPLDLISSGSGLLSQDRRKVEDENLKKQLEESKNAMEQARIQAQLAAEEAERAIQDAKQASDASRAEAEKRAQEAIAKADEARKDAELKAAEESEKAKHELEEAKKAAMEEANEAKKAAMEEAEKAKHELEEAKKAAMEEANEAKKAAMEEANEAKKAAMEEAESVKKQAESAKAAMEEEAERNRAKEAEKAARIAEKVTKRKSEISFLRSELKNIKDTESATNLRERFYNLQLNLDEDEKGVKDITDLLTKSMEDADHAGEIATYKKMADNPRRIVKKVTERVNMRPTSARPTGAPGARPAGARPTGAPGARPVGARPTGAPGARPTGAPGARPAPRRDK